MIVMVIKNICVHCTYLHHYKVNSEIPDGDMISFFSPDPLLRGGTLVVPQTFDYIGLHSAT